MKKYTFFMLFMVVVCAVVFDARSYAFEAMQKPAGASGFSSPGGTMPHSGTSSNFGSYNPGRSPGSTPGSFPSGMSRSVSANNGMPAPVMPKSISSNVIQKAQGVTNPVVTGATTTDVTTTKSSTPPAAAITTLDKLKIMQTSKFGEPASTTPAPEAQVETGSRNLVTTSDVQATDVSTAAEKGGLPAESTATQPSTLDKLAQMNPAGKALTEKFGPIFGEDNIPGVVKEFSNLSPNKQMQALEYANGDIWLYQETKGQLGADGKPLWKDSLEVMGDFWDVMSQEGQYLTKDGELITNGPFGSNGAGAPGHFEIMFRDGYTAEHLRAFGEQWCAENNVVTSCGLQELDYEKMMYAAERAGIIYMMDPQELARNLANPGNTRANAEAFLTGNPQTYVESTYTWVSTQELLGTLPSGGNNIFGDSITDSTYIPPWIQINDSATPADFAAARAEADLLYGNTSCMTDKERADLYLRTYVNKGLIKQYKW